MNTHAISRESVMDYVAYVVDDAGCGRSLDDDLHAIVRDTDTSKYPSVLVGWQCGFEPLFVAVHSYLDCYIEDDEAEEMAMEFLEEIGWFGPDGAKYPDYLIR